MPPKSDTGTGKKTPRRLFSFDAIKPSPINRTEIAPVEQCVSRPPLGGGGQLGQIGEVSGEWSSGAPDRGGGLSQSAMLSSGSGDSPAVQRKPRMGGLEGHRPAPLSNLSLRASSDEGTALPSPSRARWEHLRQHVVPGAPQPPSPPPQTQQSTSLPPRSQIPKPSRLARLGFRQVVEHVRDITHDDSRRFAFDVQKACWAARHSEHQKRGEKEAHAAMVGSALYLPFMSSTSLIPSGPATAASSQIHLSGKKHEMKRPPSVASLAAPGSAAPSLKQLYQTLLHYSTPAADGLPLTSALPHEVQVLSTLFVPFSATVMQSNTKMDEERWFAVEALGVICKTWNPSDEVSFERFSRACFDFGFQTAFVERCLWCCKAISFSLSALRSRILKYLSDMLTSNEPSYHMTSPMAFQTVMQGLFTVLSHSAIWPVQGDETFQLIEEVILAMRAGANGELDTGSIEREYNALYLGADDAKAVKESLILEALTRCIANSPAEIQEWLLQRELEVRICLAFVEYHSDVIMNADILDCAN